MASFEADYEGAIISHHTDISPTLLEAYDVWLRLKGNEKLPTWKTENFLAFPSHFLQSAVLVIREAEINDFRIVYCGSGWAFAGARDATNALVSSISPMTVAEKAGAELAEVITFAHPMKMTTNIRSRSEAPLQYDKLRMPFLDRDGDIRFVLTLEEPKTFPDKYFGIWSRTTSAENEKAMELIAKHRKQPNYSALAAYFKGIRSPFPV